MPDTGRMKRVWKLCVRDEDGFDRRQGYALAASAEDAHAVAGNPQGLHVFEKPPAMLWPGVPGAVIDWSN
jgi:hypothetical protein